MKRINFNKENITKTPFNNLKYNYNISKSLKDQILSPGDEDIPLKEKSLLNYNYNQDYSYASSIINESDININSLNNNNFKKKTLILDLDETLVHSSFKPIIYNNTFYPPDIFLTINFNGNTHKVYVLKRPFVSEFLKEMNKIYNIIIFTASVKEYANPLLDILDQEKIIKKRFFREHCVFSAGKYIKKLENINTNLKHTILVDNNPISYSFNKKNGLPIKSWHYDKNDKELLNIMNVLNFLSNVNDVREYIPNIITNDVNNINSFLKNNNEDIIKFSRNKQKNEESKISMEYNNKNYNYNLNKYSNINETKNLQKQLKNRIKDSINQFKTQIKIFQNKYNNINIKTFYNNNYIINEKNKEKNNNDIFYGFKFAKGKKEENNKNIKTELNLDKKLNFDYLTPQITNKYKNKFPQYSKSMKNIDLNNNYMQYNKDKYQNINENEKNMNLLYNNDLNRHRYNSSYKISRETNNYIKRRMKFNKEKIY